MSRRSRAKRAGRSGWRGWGAIPSPPNIMGVIGDQFFSSVKILNHFDADLTDSSSVGFTWSASGNAAVTAAQSQFGGGSLGLDGTGDYLSGTYSTANHDWFTADYTLEGWVRMTTFVGASVTANGHEQSALIGNMDPVGITNYWCFGPDQNSKLAFAYFNGAVQGFNSTGSISADTWTHIAMTLNGTTIRLFIDGTLDGSAEVSGTPQSSAAVAMALGSYNTTTTIAGFVDDLRLTKGVARYTGNFTRPPVAFPNS